MVDTNEVTNYLRRNEGGWAFKRKTSVIIHQWLSFAIKYIFDHSSWCSWWRAKSMTQRSFYLSWVHAKNSNAWTSRLIANSSPFLTTRPFFIPLIHFFLWEVLFLFTSPWKSQDKSLNHWRKPLVIFCQAFCWVRMIAIVDWRARFEKWPQKLLVQNETTHRRPQ